MATGNTPVMDLSIFQGLRTLSANIAVEMPESEVNSTHYRVLFLAALVLFMFTFIVNTLAEMIRQNLRQKYSSL
jgi:phosphate transport system permease protein